MSSSFYVVEFITPFRVSVSRLPLFLKVTMQVSQLPSQVRSFRLPHKGDAVDWPFPAATHASHLEEWKPQPGRGRVSDSGAASPTPGLRPLCPVGWPAAPTLRPGPGQQPDTGAVEVGPGMVLVRAKREDRRQVPPWLRQVALGRWPWARLLAPAPAAWCIIGNFPFPPRPAASPQRGWRPLPAPSTVVQH